MELIEMEVLFEDLVFILNFWFLSTNVNKILNWNMKEYTSFVQSLYESEMEILSLKCWKWTSVRKQKTRSDYKTWEDKIAKIDIHR